MPGLMDGIDVDPNPSPVRSSSSDTTPDTELSPPCSPYHQNGDIKDKRLFARKKLLQLTQEEKVCMQPDRGERGSHQICQLTWM